MKKIRSTQIFFPSAISVENNIITRSFRQIHFLLRGKIWHPSLNGFSLLTTHSTIIMNHNKFAIAINFLRHAGHTLFDGGIIDSTIFKSRVRVTEPANMRDDEPRLNNSETQTGTLAHSTLHTVVIFMFCS